MNISKNSNNNIDPIVIDFQLYVSRKAEFKNVCLGCFYLFTAENQSDCYCDQCSAGLRIYSRLQATKRMLAAGGEYGCH